MILRHHLIPFTLIAAATFASTACSTTAATLQETRQLELSVSPDALLAIDAGAGSLSLRGAPGTDIIRIEAEIWQVEPSDNYTLTLELGEDGSARLVSNTGSGANQDHINLDIRVPASLRLEVNDDSGSMQIAGLAGPLTVEDGSGSIRIENIGADVTIKDGSGSLRVENTGGRLRIEDGSGSITVSNTVGDVTITDDSGSISVTGTAGVVTIRDGSGSISIDGAEDFKLLGDGSGSVELLNIGRKMKPGG